MLEEDDCVNEWELQEEEEETSSRGRPAIEADRIRSAASSGGRTSSNSRYSVDGFDFAYTRGMDYAQISQELAHAAVWSSLVQEQTAPAPIEEKRRASSNDAWDVERDDDIQAEMEPIAEFLPSPEPQSLQGASDEGDAPVAIPRKIAGDFRSLPASAWAVLHAPFSPAGAPQAQKRTLPGSDGLEWTISGPLGNTEQRLDAIAAENKRAALSVTLEEEAEAGSVAHSPSGVGGDFRLSPKAAWNALHAPFVSFGKEEVSAEAVLDAAVAEAGEAPEQRPETADVLQASLEGEVAKDLAEAAAEAPAPPEVAAAVEPDAAEPLPAAARGGVAVACPADMEETADATAPQKPAEQVGEAPQEMAAAAVETTPIATDESFTQIGSERITSAENAELEQSGSPEPECVDFVQATSHVEMVEQTPAESAEEPPQLCREAALKEEKPLVESKAEEVPVESQATASLPAEAPSPAVEELIKEIVAGENSDEQVTASLPAENNSPAIEELPKEIVAEEHSAEVSAEPESLTMSKALPEPNGDASVSEGQAGTRTPTAMEPSVDTFESAAAFVSKESSVDLPREAATDIRMEAEAYFSSLLSAETSVEEVPALDREAEQFETKVEESPRDPALEPELEDDMPQGRVAPAESMEEEFGSPFGKTDKVLNSMAEMARMEADSSTDTMTTVTNMKYADANELTADPGQFAEIERTNTEDPIVMRKTKLGLEHEAWVASVFNLLAADAPLDRPVRKPGMKRMSTISIARALGCLPAGQQSASSPSVAQDSNLAHAGTNSIRSPLSSVPMSSQPRSLWTPPSPPAPSSIRSQGSSELPKVPQLVSMPPTGLRLSPSNSANSELASAARRCRSAVPGLDMTKVHMGYDDDEDTEDDHTSTLFKTHKGLTVETPTDGAKREVPTLNMAVLQKKYSASNKQTRESIVSPPAPRGTPPGSGKANMRQELSQIPPRPEAPTPEAAYRLDGLDNLRPPSRGENMVMGRPFDYWRGGIPQQRATMEEGFGRLPQRNIASAGGFGMGTGKNHMMPGLERRAVSASELHRPVPLDQPILKALSNSALGSPSRPHRSAPMSTLAVSNSVPSLPNAASTPGAATPTSAIGSLMEHDEWTLDAIGCVVADKKMQLNAPAVVRLPPVGKKTISKWQVNKNPMGFSVQKRGKATIISHTHVHHHLHYHLKRPAAAADTGSGVPVAGA